MFRHLLPLLAAGLLSAASLTTQAATAYPLTVHNCGRDLVFERAPQRLVSLGQASTELLLRLGVGSRIVGTGVWFGGLPKDLQEAGKGIPRLADNAPSFEAVVGTRPDLVAAQYTYHVGPGGEVADFPRFAKLGIAAYVAPSDCEGKAVTADSNSDGSRSSPFDMNLVTREAHELAAILDVQPAGEHLVAELDRRIAAAGEQAKAAGVQGRSVLFWFSSPRLEGDPWVAGNLGAPAWIARALGLRNVVDSAEEWPAVSWERVAALDPDYLVVARMDRRLYPADDVDKKLAFLRSDPLTRELRAVRENHLLVVDAATLNPSLRVVDGVEALAADLAKPQP
ncbi:ABC transporter substrate-binding protein [uncultured Pseudomonas sp.]|uniref:ABC transporter substrate-binding protein n=1 Tax=uncultured Pseudomonas sp. TaxID=114707 RepID=UPI0025FF01A8|nr:ABC transporter substrate-binding protein [uncultured Pseudomonas sp.]